MDSAVIFDVDGVLLELTDDEAEIFFLPFTKHLDASKLSRDWNSYRIRNDENIVEEILELNGLSSDLKQSLINDYLKCLQESLNTQVVVTTPISGAAHLISQLHGKVKTGIATANFLTAARLRLESVNMWAPVAAHARGADGGGHKSAILKRTIASMEIAPTRIVYVGDNLNDLTAATENGTHFIGFSTDPRRIKILQQAGAVHTSATHSGNAALISQLLDVDLTKGSG
jgi:phosphoglycolate phosphatase-like HAD superfamily hydrolase